MRPDANVTVPFPSAVPEPLTSIGVTETVGPANAAVIDVGAATASWHVAPEHAPDQPAKALNVPAAVA